jgi:hypothetical protein
MTSPDRAQHPEKVVTERLAAAICPAPDESATAHSTCIQRAERLLAEVRRDERDQVAKLLHPYLLSVAGMFEQITCMAGVTVEVAAYAHRARDQVEARAALLVDPS